MAWRLYEGHGRVCVQASPGVSVSADGSMRLNKALVQSVHSCIGTDLKAARLFDDPETKRVGIELVPAMSAGTLKLTGDKRSTCMVINAMDFCRKVSLDIRETRRYPAEFSTEENMVIFQPLFSVPAGSEADPVGQDGNSTLQEASQIHSELDTAGRTEEPEDLVPVPDGIPDGYITIEQAADQRGCLKSNITGILHNNSLPILTVGRRRFILKEPWELWNAANPKRTGRRSRQPESESEPEEEPHTPVKSVSQILREARMSG